MQNTETKLALLPQEAFFSRVEERPKGLSDRDLFAFVQTQLEAFSPLPPEVLRWGFCADAGRVMYFAASADRLSRWKWIAGAFERADCAVPAAALLWQCPMRDGWNLFKRPLDASNSEYVAVKVSGGAWEEVAACSQASDLPDSDVLAKLSAVASENVSGTPALFDASLSAFGKVSVRISDGGKSGTFKVGGSKFFERADVRDPVTLKAAKHRNFNARLGGMLLRAAVCAFAACLLWQLSFVWQKSRQAGLDGRLAVLEPEAEKVMLLSSEAAFLEGVNSKKMYNMLMLAKINSVRPEGVSYSKTVAGGAGSMELRGKAQSVAVLNKFETALKSAPFVKRVEKKISSSQKDGSAWTMNIEFKD